MNKTATIILIVVGLIVGIGGTIVITKLSKRVVSYRTELSTKEGEYTDKLNEHVRQTQTAIIRIDELIELQRKDSADISEYQKRLKWAYNNIEAMDLKLKKVKEVTVVTTEVSGDFATPLTPVDSGAGFDFVLGGVLDSGILWENYEHTYYSEFNDGYLEQYFTVDLLNDTIYSNYTYTDTLLVVDNWVRQPNKNGKPVFILWRWVKPWEVHIEAKTGNQNSQVVNIDNVLIQKRTKNGN